MSRPTSNRAALSDVTNIAAQLNEGDQQPRVQKVLRERCRRAEMSDAQREEIRRKQRDYQRRYREKKKAESKPQNSSASCASTRPLQNIGQNAAVAVHGTGHQYENIGQNENIIIGSAKSVATSKDTSNTKMDGMNTQRGKRKAEMTSEQREESKRRHCKYQRQYRAKKKARLQISNGTTPATGVGLETGLSTTVEIEQSEEPTDWLHRNDKFVPGRRGPREVLSGQLRTPGDSRVHIPAQHHKHVDVQHNQDEFDREIFEPTHDESVLDDNAMDDEFGLHRNLYPEDGDFQRNRRGPVYESYRVLPPGRAVSTVKCGDTYDFIYRNLPK